MPSQKISKLFREFVESERTGGLLLLACTVISLLLANSPWGEAYSHLWHQKVGLSIGPVLLDYSVEHWINDGMMAVFFLLVGLEIERELYVGELKEFSNAVLPVAAALAGMVFPAAIHFALNQGTAYQNGFGIPMATDIAFALGMLSLLGNRVPPTLKVFLTALAIIDDLGAILIIAIFYNHGLQWVYLAAASGVLAVLILMNRLKVRKLVWYLLAGIVLWYCMLQSGVHATLAGVILAFTIPFNRNQSKHPSEKLQHLLHKPVAFIVLPLFALANTGLIFSDNWLAALGNSHGLGIMGGLALGKPLGILLICWILVKTGRARLPDSVGWGVLTGLGFMAGIGFTMSIFISNLAFDDPEMIQSSKMAVLFSSMFACLLGLIILAAKSKKPDN